MANARQVVILGGGITGLSAAFHLSRRLPRSVRITLVESQPRLGGWLQSDRVFLESHEGHKGSVLLEAGPRTLRPNSPAMLELVNLLGLKTSVIAVPKTAPAARNRYIHIPPLTLMPSSVTSLLLSPFSEALRPLLPAVLQELFKRRNRPTSDDESVDEFFSRRFGEEFARRFGSALMHGIYAADSRALSVRAVFPTLWETEDRGRGSLLLGVARGRTATTTTSTVEASEPSYDLGSMEELTKDVSVYSFKDGLESVTRALEDCLSAQENVETYKGIEALAVRAGEDSFQVETSGPLPNLSASHVISALPLPRLQALLPDGNMTPLLTANQYSTVLLLNLVFPSFAHPQGFGYLVPRPMGGYGISTHSPGILGTVFDSASVEGQDTISGVTKMTMMSGGPYTVRFGEPYLPEYLHALQEQLGVPIPDPIYHRFVLQRNCIPTPGVSHPTRMSKLKEILKQEPYHGRMEVVGAEVGGVSVGDCVKQGREAAVRIAHSMSMAEG